MSVQEHHAAPPETNGAGSHSPLRTRSPYLELAADRGERLARVVAGETNEIDADDVLLAFEVDSPAMQNDHTRLIRAASLAIQYYQVNAAGRGERAFLRRAASVFQVEEQALEAYVLVLQREIRHREKTGSSPLADLPLLTRADELREPAVEGPLALPPSSSPKHDPSEYVALAEQGLNNTEIAKRLGDVSEASVRRGLAAAGYSRTDR
jgi:hypothetical protein